MKKQEVTERTSMRYGVQPVTGLREATRIVIFPHFFLLVDFHSRLGVLVVCYATTLLDCHRFTDVFLC